MTAADQQTIVYASMSAIRRLVTNHRQAELERHLMALTAVFNDHAASEFQRGLERGRVEATTLYDQGKRDGMMAVEARMDRRDLDDVQDPMELRSVH